MYSISGKFDNAIDLLAYTISAMLDSGFMQSDIDEFLLNAIGKGNFNLLSKSVEAIEECNKVIKDSIPNNWRDSYYSKSDEERLIGYFDDEDNYCDCDYELEFTPESSYMDEEEAYEGFDSCSNHFYNPLGDYDFDSDSDDIYDLNNFTYKY